MKFKQILTSKCKIKKKKEYEFEITDDNLKEIRKNGTEVTIIKANHSQVILAFLLNGKIHLTLFADHYGFEELAN